MPSSLRRILPFASKLYAHSYLCWFLVRFLLLPLFLGFVSSSTPLLSFSSRPVTSCFPLLTRLSATNHGPFHPSLSSLGTFRTLANRSPFCFLFTHTNIFCPDLLLVFPTSLFLPKIFLLLDAPLPFAFALHALRWFFLVFFIYDPLPSQPVRCYAFILSWVLPILLPTFLRPRDFFATSSSF